MWDGPKNGIAGAAAISKLMQKNNNAENLGEYMN